MGIKESIEKLHIHDTIKEFNKLDLKLDRSPSNQYFRDVFNKIYGNICLNITTELLDKIYTLYGKSVETDVKTFLYAYVIVINHHEIFGYNTKLERVLIRSSLDMLYMFSKICDKIYNNKFSRLEQLIVLFMDKYKKYCRYFNKWKENEAKDILDILTYCYHNLSNNLKKINENDITYNSMTNKMNEIETKMQYLMIDNPTVSFDPDKLKRVVDDHYWDMLLYNLENNIQLNSCIRHILKVIETKVKDKNWDKGPVPIYLNYIDDMVFDFELFGNKHFFNMIYYLIEITDDTPATNDFQLDIKKHICEKKYKRFAHELLRKDYSVVLPKFFRSLFHH